MRVKTISVAYERKWNMGSYESASLGVTAWADLDLEDDEEEAIARLWAFVKGQVREQSLPLLNKRRGGYEDEGETDAYAGRS